MSVKSVITRSATRSVYRLKRNSPHILFGTGIVGAVSATVLACKATLQVEPVMDGLKEEIDEVKTGGSQKDVAYVYGKAVRQVACPYIPAVLVGGVSIGLLTGAHVQLTRRNTSLTIAYAGLHKAYDEYRNRVREAVGEDRERDLYLGVREESVDDGGKSKKIKTIDPNKTSQYARCFYEVSPNWTPDPELNLVFIKCQQKYANDLLISRGYLFLNEVYNMLGLDISSAGQAVGWVINGDGDNFVDFGIYEARNAEFANGLERNIWLDFNVDGVIIDKI